MLFALGFDFIFFRHLIKNGSTEKRLLKYNLFPYVFESNPAAELLESIEFSGFKFKPLLTFKAIKPQTCVLEFWLDTVVSLIPLSCRKRAKLRYSPNIAFCEEDFVRRNLSNLNIKKIHLSIKKHFNETIPVSTKYTRTNVFSRIILPYGLGSGEAKKILKKNIKLTKKTNKYSKRIFWEHLYVNVAKRRRFTITKRKLLGFCCLAFKFLYLLKPNTPTALTFNQLKFMVLPETQTIFYKEKIQIEINKLNLKTSLPAHNKGRDKEEQTFLLENYIISRVLTLKQGGKDRKKLQNYKNFYTHKSNALSPSCLLILKAVYPGTTVSSSDYNRAEFLKQNFLTPPNFLFVFAKIDNFFFTIFDKLTYITLPFLKTAKISHFFALAYSDYNWVINTTYKLNILIPKPAHTKNKDQFSSLLFKKTKIFKFLKNYLYGPSNENILKVYRFLNFYVFLQNTNNTSKQFWVNAVPGFSDSAAISTVLYVFFKNLRVSLRLIDFFDTNITQVLLKNRTAEKNLPALATKFNPLSFFPELEKKLKIKAQKPKKISEEVLSDLNTTLVQVKYFVKLGEEFYFTDEFAWQNIKSLGFSNLNALVLKNNFFLTILQKNPIFLMLVMQLAEYEFYTLINKTRPRKLVSPSWGVYFLADVLEFGFKFIKTILDRESNSQLLSFFSTFFSSSELASGRKGNELFTGPFIEFLGLGQANQPLDKQITALLLNIYDSSLFQDNTQNSLKNLEISEDRDKVFYFLNPLFNHVQKKKMPFSFYMVTDNRRVVNLKLYGRFRVQQNNSNPDEGTLVPFRPTLRRDNTPLYRTYFFFFNNFLKKKNYGSIHDITSVIYKTGNKEGKPIKSKNVAIKQCYLHFLAETKSSVVQTVPGFSFLKLIVDNYLQNLTFPEFYIFFSTRGLHRLPKYTRMPYYQENAYNFYNFFTCLAVIKFNKPKLFSAKIQNKNPYGSEKNFAEILYKYGPIQKSLYSTELCNFVNFYQEHFPNILKFCSHIVCFSNYPFFHFKQKMRFMLNKSKLSEKSKFGPVNVIKTFQYLLYFYTGYPVTNFFRVFHFLNKTSIIHYLNIKLFYLTAVAPLTFHKNLPTKKNLTDLIAKKLNQVRNQKCGIKNFYRKQNTTHFLNLLQKESIQRNSNYLPFKHEINKAKKIYFKLVFFKTAEKKISLWQKPICSPFFYFPVFNDEKRFKIFT